MGSQECLASGPLTPKEKRKVNSRLSCLNFKVPGAN